MPQFMIADFLLAAGPVAIALFAVLMLQVLDALTTYIALDKGKGREANPIVAKLMDRLGLAPALLLVKIAGAVAALFIAASGAAYAVCVLGAIALLYGVIVTQNARIAFRK